MNWKIIVSYEIIEEYTRSGREREREKCLSARVKKKEGKKNEALRKYRSLSACKSCKYYTSGAKFPVSVKDAMLLSRLFPLCIRGKFRITVLLDDERESTACLYRCIRNSPRPFSFFFSISRFSRSSKSSHRVENITSFSVSSKIEILIRRGYEREISWDEFHAIR